MRRRIILENAAAKRLLNIKRGEKVEAGTLITRFNAQKAAKPTQDVPKNPVVRTAVMGLV